MSSDEDTLRTNWMLVARLKNVGDDDSWREFYELYRPLILGVSLKAGLREEEAKEVLQETMASVAGHIAEFEATGARGSLRGWLLTMVRWRIQDQLRKRMPASGSAVVGPADATATTATVERVADPVEVDLERLCDAEWEERLKERAMKELQCAVKAEHYQVFYLLAVEQKPVALVAAMVGRSRAQVYLIKHRVGKALRRIVKQFEKRFEESLRRNPDRR